MLLSTLWRRDITYAVFITGLEVRFRDYVGSWGVRVWHGFEGPSMAIRGSLCCVGKPRTFLG